MRVGIVSIRILAAALLASGLGTAAPNPAQHSLPRPPASLFDLTWVLADFNGDQQPDFASARLANRHGQEYAHEVSVRLGSAQTSFRFRSHTAKIELSARDVDGDEDRDIVVLEAHSKQPLGVWLNDGAGSFEEGDLAKFRRSIGDASGPVWSAVRGPFAIPAILEQRVPSALPWIASASQDRRLEILPSTRDSLPCNTAASNLRTRAPPRI